MKQAVIISLILGGALSRLIPHVPNLTAVTAIALLGGAYLSQRWAAVLVPIAALWVSDLILGFHSTMLYVYSAVALIALASSFLLKDSAKLAKFGGLSVVASVFFFLVTNFGVWMNESLYPKTGAGLVSCYVMALPFLATQVVGDLFYTLLLVGAVQALRMWSPAFFESKSAA